MIVKVNGKATELKSFFDGHSHIPTFPKGIEGTYKNNQWIGKSK